MKFRIKMHCKRIKAGGREIRSDILALLECGESNLYYTTRS